MTLKLADDCFVLDKDRLPHGEALAILKSRVRPVVEAEEVTLDNAAGRYLAEAIVIGLALFALVGFYTLTTKNYGGLCAGFRWLLPIVPLLLLFVAEWLSQLRKRVWFALFLVLMAVGQFHAYAALRGPWEPSSWDRWLTS